LSPNDSEILVSRLIDEIVEPHITPLDYQIRDSNGAQLTAQAKSCADAKFYGIVKDGRDELFAAIQKVSSECDILILTGGVSMGEFDYVPQVLTECGFKMLFDRIAVQPGKPSTFGIQERVNPGKEIVEPLKVVFALPGNPVSSYIQFEMLVRPFIMKSMGGSYFPKSIILSSATEYKRRNSGRTALIPVTIEKKRHLYAGKLQRICTYSGNDPFRRCCNDTGGRCPN
jgi:molybdopterin molybdotransferase